MHTKNLFPHDHSDEADNDEDAGVAVKAKSARSKLVKRTTDIHRGYMTGVSNTEMIMEVKGPTGAHLVQADLAALLDAGMYPCARKDVAEGYVGVDQPEDDDFVSTLTAETYYRERSMKISFG